MRTAISLITLGTLAACGQGGDGNGAAGGVSPGAAAAVALQPGQWESRVVNAGGEGPQPRPGARPMTARFCITPEQAANPTAAALTGEAREAGCETMDYSITGGRIQGTTVCTIETGGSVRMTVNGQYTATTYEMTIRSQIETGGQTHDGEMRVDARRIGDCPPGAAAPGGNSTG